MLRNSFARLSGAIVFSVLLVSSCAPRIPKEALQLTPQSLKNRQLQTRSFDTDEKTLLVASAGVLQDLGFTIDETEANVGVVVCSKRRSAVVAGQVAASICLAGLAQQSVPWDKEQIIRASLVTHPVYIDQADKSQDKTAVRITFQRIVINTQGQVTRREFINEPRIYQEFFDKLSQSVFLEAHEI
jgi:hypothetical protein